MTFDVERVRLAVEVDAHASLAEVRAVSWALFALLLWRWGLDARPAMDRVEHFTERAHRLRAKATGILG